MRRNGAGGIGAAGRRLRVSRSDLLATAPIPTKAVPDGISLNRLCGADAWEHPDWLGVYRALALPSGEARLHRKSFEWTHAIYGLERLGSLGPETRVLGVGAGHEWILYYLANRSRITVATDLYSGDFAEDGAQEAAPDFLADPGRYAPFPYQRRNLIAVPANGLRLPFRGDAFDVVYSLSSIEHFGGHDAAAAAVREMARVLRPGGIACIATEYVLAGGKHPEFFDREDLHRYVLSVAPLVPVDQLDLTPPGDEFLADPIRFPDVQRTPHLVLEHGGIYWTSVVLFLRKPARRDWLRLLLHRMRNGVPNRPG